MTDDDASPCCLGVLLNFVLHVVLVMLRACHQENGPPTTIPGFSPELGLFLLSSRLAQKDGTLRVDDEHKSTIGVGVAACHCDPPPCRAEASPCR